MRRRRSPFSRFSLAKGSKTRPPRPRGKFKQVPNFIFVLFPSVVFCYMSFLRMGHHAAPAVSSQPFLPGRGPAKPAPHPQSKFKQVPNFIFVLFTSMVFRHMKFLRMGHHAAPAVSSQPF